MVYKFILLAHSLSVTAVLSSKFVYLFINITPHAHYSNIFYM